MWAHGSGLGWPAQPLISSPGPRPSSEGASAGSTGVPGREWASGPTLLLLKEGCLPFKLGGWNGTTWKAGKAERNVSKEALSPLWTWSWDQEFILPVPIPPLVAEASVP